MTPVTVRSITVASALASLAAASIAASTDASVVLSNLPGSNASGFNSGNRAMKFTTGSGSWTLQSATVYAYSSGTLFMEIWTDASGTLGSVFATGSISGSGTGDKTGTFTATTLAGNTNYWLVFGNTGPFSATLTYDTSTVATQQNSSGWVGYGSSLDYNYSTTTWDASATTTWFALDATAVPIPAPGAAGLAACALFARSRRRRR